MVGLLGEVTGRVALERLRDELRESEEGRFILEARPVVTTEDADAPQARPGWRGLLGSPVGRRSGRPVGRISKIIGKLY